MARDMSSDEWKAFVMAGTRTAKLAVTRADGRPHVAPIWIVLDGEDVVFTTAATTVKGKAIVRDGRVALCVDDERPPYAFARIEGTARVSEDLDEMLRWATAIGGRYMGTERADELGRRNAVAGELLVRVTRGVVAVSSRRGRSRPSRSPTAARPRSRVPAGCRCHSARPRTRAR